MNVRTIIVDDDSIILMLHSRLVMKSGMDEKPLSYSNAPDALEYIYGPASDETDAVIVLLDINMPGMNGWGFLDELQKKEPPVEVIVAMATSSIDTTDRKRAGEYKFVIDYIDKPISFDKLNRIKESERAAPFFK